MAIIQSGAASNNLTIDPTSKAARTTPYDTAGNVLVGYNTPAKATTVTQASAATYSIVAKAITSGSISNTVKVMAYVYHIEGSSKDVRLHSVRICFDSANVAANTLTWRLFWADTNVTAAIGGTAVTPTPYDQSDPPAEVLCATVPTNTGNYTNTAPFAVWRNLMGIIAGTTTDQFRDGIWLWRDTDLSSIKPPRLRAGVGEGWVLELQATASAITVISTIEIILSEE